MFWRSKDILQRPDRSMIRGAYKSMGYSDYDLARPLIGIANSWNRVVPGHYNLHLVSEYVKQGILQAGGTPVEFGVIAACDGIAQGHVGMHYILPTRDLIANDVEMMVQAHQLDAVVLLGSCDKIVPGMLMAAARLDVPAIVVVGRPDGRRAASSTAAPRTSPRSPRGWACSRPGRSTRRPTAGWRTAPRRPAAPARSWARPTRCAAWRRPWACACRARRRSRPRTPAACAPPRRPAGRSWSWSSGASPPGRSSTARGSKTRSASMRRSAARRTAHPAHPGHRLRGRRGDHHG